MDAVSWVYEICRSLCSVFNLRFKQRPNFFGIRAVDHLQKYSGDSVIVGRVSRGQKTDYRELLDHFVAWCRYNHLISADCLTCNRKVDQEILACVQYLWFLVINYKIPVHAINYNLCNLNMNVQYLLVQLWYVFFSSSHIVCLYIFIYCSFLIFYNVYFIRSL